MTPIRVSYAVGVHRIRGLSPAEFAFVMATGIISTALAADAARYVSLALLAVAIAAYLMLCVIHLTRLACWPGEFLAELVSPRGFTFLTFVAASNVLSTRMTNAGVHWAGAVLLVIGFVAWLGLGYGVPLGLIAHARRDSVFDPVNGTWFLWVVGTQSVAVAAATLAHATARPDLAALAAICWAIGVVQWLLIASVEFARLLLRRLELADSVAPFWVFMGSAAISIVAGAKVSSAPAADQLLAPDFVRTLSMVLWGFATWLIPLLVGLMIWQRGRQGLALDYRTTWWAMVFPVGMYGVACRELGLVTDQSWLVTTADWEAWVALAVWLIVLVALFVHERVLHRPDAPDRPATTPLG
ncbi:hypothetical protein G4X40_21300 [Rhodococcus sp. D2-41]|uniref:Tellurite resistance/C4-dicarboxylate transporter family protein n=1 Tax=Speluncibacter jeojiensis TaxID=2710754 RepID=A0A9X4RDX1_9ACTN|nr:tellurite resistance/C4-dicarboxylate transporter family protein [Rhodococcus sp. D2-41]MDG3012680.1 hypothetical protein [Rhodococcus sp. D2-41]MDG3015214.1 tellurite resistance/C4-dicarboxylate transporter family protein [Corynebacteriales bacterium D3-21]